MPWSPVLPPMQAGTICPRSTCRPRRPRPSPLQLPPKRRTLLQLPGSPAPARAVPSAIRAQPQASRRPRTRPKPSSAASSVSQPSSSRWSNHAEGHIRRIMQPCIIRPCIIFACGLYWRTCISTEVACPPRSLASRRGTILEFESPAVLRLPLQLGVRPHVKEPSWPV